MRNGLWQVTANSHARTPFFCVISTQLMVDLQMGSEIRNAVVAAAFLGEITLLSLCKFYYKLFDESTCNLRSWGNDGKEKSFLMC